VTNALLAVAANSTNKVYGQGLVFAGSEFTVSGLVSTDSVTGASATLASTGTNAAAAVGSYAINITNLVGESGLTNYSVSYVSGVLTIEPPGKVTITSIVLTDPNHAQITGTGTAGVVYTIQASSDLINWQTIGTATAGTNGVFNFQDSNITNYPYRFYRVVLTVTPPGEATITSIVLTDPNDAQITGTGTAGEVYTIQASSDLINWQTIGTATAGAYGVFNFQDSNIASFNSRFYRAKL
jgi:hypothetical protein